MYIAHPFPRENYIDLTINQFGRRECYPGHMSNFVSHKHYVFHYIFSGKGILTIEGDNKELTVYPVEKGQGFLIFPGYRTTYRADNFDPWHYVWIEFDGIKARDIIHKSGLGLTKPVYTGTDLTVTAKMVDSMTFLINNPTKPDLELMSHFYMFINCLIESSNHKGEIPCDRVKDFYIREAVQFIKQNYFKDITIKDIADHLNIHRSYLSRIFKGVMNTTPQDYLIKCRIDMACVLLKTSNTSINEVAAMVGYANQLNFSRAFKRLTGVSPKHYK